MKAVLAAFAAVCAFAQFTASTRGQQWTIAVPVNYGDSPAPCGFTADQLRAIVFGSDPVNHLDGFYRAVTNNRIWFIGDVADCVTVPARLTQLTTTTLPDITAAVEQVLVARGYDMNRYNRRLLALPYIAGRNGSIGSFGAGSTTAGGTQYSIAWMTCSANPFSPTVPVACTAMAHEVGHNLKFTHAAAIGIPGDRGDYTDIMGTCGGCGFNAPHWTIAGWGVPRDVAASGTYTVGVLDVTGDMLRIGAYYLALRSRGTADLHQWAGGAEDLPYFVKTFSVGQTFSTGDPYITLLEKTATSATFSVQIGSITLPPPPPPPPPPPSTAAPVVTPSTAVVPWHQSAQFVADQNVTWTLSGYGSLSYTAARAALYSASGNPKGGRATLTATNVAGQSTSVTITVPKR